MPMDYNALFRQIAAASASLRALDAIRSGSIPAIAALASADDAARRAADRGSASLASLARGLADGAGRSLASLTASERGASGGPLAALARAMARDGQSVRSGGVRLGWLPRVRGQGMVAMASSCRDGRGATCDTAFRERFLAAPDSSLASFTMQGGDPVDRLDPSWPAGSGVRVSVPVTRATSGAGTRTNQVLSDGEFDRFTSGRPSDWTVDAWPAAVSSGSPVGSGVASLRFTGDGYSRPSVSQPIAGNSPGLLAACVFARTSAIPASGELEIALVDNLGSVAIGGDGAPCSARLDLTRGVGLWGYGKWGSGQFGRFDGGGAFGRFPWGRIPWGSGIGGPYVPLSAVFALPYPAASGLRLAIRLSKPLPSGVNLQLDRAMATAPTTLYAGGPSVALFAGDPGPTADYGAFLDVDNDGSASLAWAVERLFGARDLGVSLPSSATPTLDGRSVLATAPGVALAGSAGLMAGGASGGYGGGSGGLVAGGASDPFGLMTTTNP